jgi:hypothetical protein
MQSRLINKDNKQIVNSLIFIIANHVNPNVHKRFADIFPAVTFILSVCSLQSTLTSCDTWPCVNGQYLDLLQ